MNVKMYESKKAQLPCWLSTGHTRGVSEKSNAHGVESMQERDQLWLSNPGQTSYEIQNRGISGSTRWNDCSKYLQKDYVFTHVCAEV